MKTNEPTHTHNLNKVMSEYHFNHRGCLVEKLIGGYRWNNKNFKTLIEVDEEIQKGLDALNKKWSRNKSTP